MSLTGHAEFGRPFVVSITGGSASGKTHLAERLREAFGPGRAAIVSMDNYYAPADQTERYLRDGEPNYDQPIAIEFEWLARDLRSLRAGRPVDIIERIYSPSGDRERALTVPARPVLILEGIFALESPLRELADLTVFVDADPALRLDRRVRRDVARGFTETEVRSYFERVVRPMHDLYVQPSALKADLVFESENDAVAMGRIVGFLRNTIDHQRAVNASQLEPIYAKALVHAHLRAIQTQTTPTLDLLVHDDKPIREDRIRDASETIHALLSRPRELTEYLRKHPIVVTVNGLGIMAAGNPEILLALRAMNAKRVLTRSCTSMFN